MLDDPFGFFETEKDEDDPFGFFKTKKKKVKKEDDPFGLFETKPEQPLPIEQPEEPPQIQPEQPTELEEKYDPQQVTEVKRFMAEKGFKKPPEASDQQFYEYGYRQYQRSKGLPPVEPKIPQPKEEELKLTVGEKIAKFPLIKYPTEAIATVGEPIWRHGVEKTSLMYEYLTSRFGENPLSNLFKNAKLDARRIADDLSKAGLEPGAITTLLNSAGIAGGAIMNIEAFGGMKALPFTMGVGAGAEAWEMGLPEGKRILALIKGGTEGFLMKKIFGTFEGLPPAAKTSVTFGTFTGMGLAGGKSLDESIADGIVFSVLGWNQGRKTLPELKIDFKEAREVMRKLDAEQMIDPKTVEKIENLIRKTENLPEYRRALEIERPIEGRPIEMVKPPPPEIVKEVTKPEDFGRLVEKPAGIVPDIIPKGATGEWVKPPEPSIRPPEEFKPIKESIKPPEEFKPPVKEIKYRAPEKVETTGEVDKVIKVSKKPTFDPLEPLERTTHDYRETVAKQTIKTVGETKLIKHIDKYGLEPTKDINADEMNVIAGKLGNYLIKKGDMKGAMRLETITKSPLRKGGQFIEATKHYIESPFGILKTARLAIDKMRTPKEIDKIERAAKRFGKMIDQINKEALPEVLRRTEKVIRSKLRDLDINLDKLVRKHYTKVEEVGKTLKEKILEETSISDMKAGEIADTIEREFKRLTSYKKGLILNRLTKPRKKYERKTKVQQLIELSNVGAFDNEALHGILSEKFKIPFLNEALAKKIVEQGKRVLETPEGDAKDWEMWRLNKLVVGERKVKAWQKLAVIQTGAQLLRPKTIIRNIISNAVYAHFDMAAQATAGVLADKFISRFTKRRTVAAWTPKQYGVYTKGYAKAITTELKRISKGVDISGQELLRRVGGDKEILKGLDISKGLLGQHDIRSGILKSELGKLTEKALAMGLRADDRGRFWAAFEESIFNQMKASGIKGKRVTEPTPDMFRQAVVLGLERTFQDPNIISNFFVKTKRLLNTFPFMGELLMKYPKTPSNLMVRATEMSPLGFIRATKLLFDACKNGEYGTQYQASSKIGRAGLGTAMFGLLTYLAFKGVITGGRKEKAKEYAWTEAVGKQKNSINLSALTRWHLSGFEDNSLEPQEGDKFVSYNWFQPFSLELAGAANLAVLFKSRGKENKELNTLDFLLSIAGHTYTSAIKTYSEEDFSANLMRHFTTYGSATNKIHKTLASIPRSFFPGLVTDVKYALDPELKYTKSKEGDLLDDIWLSIKSKIPWLSKEVPARRDVFGNTINVFGKKGKSRAGKFIDILALFGSPVIVKKYRTSEGIRFIEGLYEEIGKIKDKTPEEISEMRQKILPRRVTRKKYIDLDYMRLRFTPEIRMRYQQLVGEQWEDAMKRLVSWDIGKWTIEDQVREIYIELNEIGKFAKEKLFEEFHVDYK